MAGAWPILTKLTLARRIAVRFVAPNFMKSLFSRWYSYRIEERMDVCPTQGVQFLCLLRSIQTATDWLTHNKINRLQCIKARGGVEVQFHSFLISTPDGVSGHLHTGEVPPVAMAPTVGMDSSQMRRTGWGCRQSNHRS